MLLACLKYYSIEESMNFITIASDPTCRIFHIIYFKFGSYVTDGADPPDIATGCMHSTATIGIRAVTLIRDLDAFGWQL